VKLQQDRMIAKASSAGLSSLILCPPNISGTYSDYLVNLVEMMRVGKFAMLEGGSAPCNLVDVYNLAHAAELALNEGPGRGERFFVTDDENTTWRDLVGELLPLMEPDFQVPSIELHVLTRGDIAAERTPHSILRSIKHLVSSDVRQALRKDPLWESADTALRRGIARMGNLTENALRRSIEGPTKIVKTPSSQPQINAQFCRQQLRRVRHSCELAKIHLGYRPIYTFAASVEAFRRWYRDHHGMNLAVWPLLRQLYLS
jgi:nucleoside-diphosphate-sugar epimerase